MHEDPKEVKVDAEVFVSKGKVVGYRSVHTFKGDVSSRITVSSGETSEGTQAETVEPQSIVEQDVIGKRLDSVKKVVQL